MTKIPPIEPTSTVSQDHGGEKGKRTPKTQTVRATIMKDIAVFDNAYSTTLTSLIENQNPQAAYDHIRQSGMYDNYAKMDAYTLIYSWLHEELSVADVSDIERGMWGKVQDLLNNIFVDKRPGYEALMGYLETEITTWFAERMGEARTHQIGSGLPIPKGYDIFPSKAPEGSSLSAELHKIFNN